jgi:lipid-binding SYLF domain-containing protein
MFQLLNKGDNNMHMNLLYRICTMITVIMIFLAPVVSAASIGEKRQAIRDMSNETLDKLYEVHPKARKAIKNAAGYAVFSNYGIKVIVLGGGRGKGMVIDRNSGREVFMKKADVGLGLGLGVKNYREVFVFEDKKALNRFIDQGWQLGGQATFAATDGVTGGAFQGAVSIWPGAWLYQITDKGLALEVTGQGTRYYKDSDLN